MPAEQARFKPMAFAKAEEVEAQGRGLSELVDRFAVVERALAAVIEDVDEIVRALTEGAAAEEEASPSRDVDGEPEADYVEPTDAETPEEEAARLRMEAMTEFEQANESPELAPTDFNDFAGHD